MVFLCLCVYNLCSYGMTASFTYYVKFCVSYQTWPGGGSGGTAHSPPVGGEGLGGDHVQGVPRRDAQAVVQAQHEDHHGLAGAEPQEEAADARQHHGATWRAMDTSTWEERRKRRRRGQRGRKSDEWGAKCEEE